MKRKIAGASYFRAALAISSALVSPLSLAQAKEAGSAETASAADAAEAPQPKAADIVVTGFRASLKTALGMKRSATEIIDSINAEDIAKFPEANLAESIQRISGVSISRDNGEGRQITVRGLGGQFQTTRVNGMDALAVVGGNVSDSAGNRTRGVDFNTFSSSIFSGIVVRKTQSASIDEGSLGATIDLNTGRPLASKANKLALVTSGEYRENAGSFNPRFSALGSYHVTSNLGILVSASYEKNHNTIDSYSRPGGQPDYLYRNSAIAGKSGAYGFALPSNQGSGILYGSDPSAYAALNNTTIIPALASINHQDLRYERLGGTATIQWQPSSHTEVVIDGVFSRYHQVNVTNELQTIGLNRNGTNANATNNTLGTGTTGIKNRYSVYPTCAVSSFRDCGQALNGGSLVSGTYNSYNPNNLDPYDYYNWSGSPGYAANAQGINYYNQLIGRPSTAVMAAHVNGANQADYLQLNNLDWRSDANSQDGTTIFKQFTLNLKQEIGDRMVVNATAGYSRNDFHSQGFLVEFNAVDQNGYTYDERGGGNMPVFNPGFNVADPNNWSLVKGLSVERLINNTIKNDFKLGRLNFDFRINDRTHFLYGLTYKEFSYSETQSRRDTSIEAINPTLAEARMSITQLGQMVNFGKGLQLPSGTPTSFYAPNLQAFKNAFGIDCNCINKWGDYRLLSDGRNANLVTEQDLGAFAQLNFDIDLFGRPLRGNGGLRWVQTTAKGTGSIGGGATSVGTSVTGKHVYDDWLPSLNLNYWLGRDFVIRAAAAKVMSRPQLQNLTPGTTSVSTSLATTSTSAPTITLGNPNLNPFRANTYDLSIEKYLPGGGLISVALFYKDIKSFPQQLVGEAPLSSAFSSDVYNQVLATLTDANLYNYTAGGGVWAIRQYQDAPGGYVRGIEVNLQHDLAFLGRHFKNFGVMANYTHIDSKLSYLTSSTSSTLKTTSSGSGTAANTYAQAPFLNTSPDAFNATVYYEDDKRSLRLSSAYRARYVSTFPLATGTCSVGTTTNAGGPCNSPVMADFGYTENTFYLDLASGYQINNLLRLTLDVRNLTNAATRQTIYAANPLTSLYQNTGRVITLGARLVI